MADFESVARAVAGTIAAGPSVVLSSEKGHSSASAEVL